MSTQNTIKLSAGAKNGLAVLAKGTGKTTLGRFNSTESDTIHHNSLKVLVAEGLASDTKTAKARKLVITAAGRKQAKAHGLA